jgi:glycosyltransferase involved in cell wall biosynthesis
MKVSIITPCFNSAATIKFTIESVLAQSYGDLELLVMDGESSDETRKIVLGYQDNRIQFISAPDKGMYDAVNKGLVRMQGDVVGVLNADDCYKDEHVLRDTVEALGKAPAVHGHLSFVKDHDTKHVVRRWRGRPMPKGGFKSGWMPAHPTFYIRTDAARQIGPYDLGFRVASDYDWMLRAVHLHKLAPVLLDRDLVEMQIGGASTRGIGAYFRHNLEALGSRQKWLNAGQVDLALVAKPLSKVFQFM